MFLFRHSAGVRRLKALCVLLLLGLLEIPDAWAGVASLDWVWDTRQPLRGCFFGGDSDLRSQIAGTANEWTLNTGVVFDFGHAPNFNTCDARQKYDIRVSFDRPGFWGFVGTQGQRVAPSQPTVNISMQSADIDEKYRHKILQVFGHVLGFLHQEQDPQSRCRVDTAYIRQKFSISSSALEESVQVPNNGRYLLTPFDGRSVMRLLDVEQSFVSGSPAQCWEPEADSLSAGDHHLAQIIYPPRPSDIGISGGSGAIAVNFFGAGAASSFAFFLNSLHQAQKIELKKIVQISGKSIKEQLAKEGIIVNDTIPDDLDNFLCQLNPHICKDSGKRRTWFASPANENYRESDLKCGDPSLPRYVFCIPNIRVMVSATRITLNYNPARDNLQTLVIDRLEGCEKWDDACKSLVQGLNQKREGGQTQTADVLSPRFSGQIILPSRSYRLALQYSGVVDRYDVVRLLAAIKKQRADVLHVQEADLGITLTAPVRDPKPLVARVLSEPIEGYTAAFRAMHYPLDDSSEADLNKYPMVDIGIWDTHVDETHCDLSRAGNPVIYSILSNQSGESAPPSDNDCQKMHDDHYKISLRYDHGTAVAGLLAAQVNGKGIAGINPRVRMWAWELISGDQLNQNDDGLIILQRKHPNFNPRVVNISLSFPVQQRVLKTSLENFLFGAGPMQPGLDNQLLLVAAAGNDVDINAHPEGFPVNSGSDCLIFPACWSNDDPERGIISVVALNGDGTNLLKDQNGQIITNYGRVFDVSAVGAVATTMHGNFFGRAYGTSFAAPYVTGLASLIYAKAGYAHLNPTVTQVKNRILFSSDLEPPFLQFARFGRINFRTALRFQDNLIVYKPRANCPSPCEITANIARDTDEALVLTSGKKGNAHIAAGTLIPMKYVRRLALQDDGTFIIVFLEDGSLTKITNAQIRLQANRNIMTTTTGTEPFPLNDIKDYISCSVYPACELP